MITIIYCSLWLGDGTSRNCFQPESRSDLYNVQCTMYNVRKLYIVQFICGMKLVAEFKEFERRFKFKPRFKYGWFHLKLYQMLRDLSLRLV